MATSGQLLTKQVAPKAAGFKTAFSQRITVSHNSEVSALFIVPCPIPPPFFYPARRPAISSNSNNLPVSNCCACILLLFVTVVGWTSKPGTKPPCLFEPSSLYKQRRDSTIILFLDYPTAAIRTNQAVVTWSFNARRLGFLHLSSSNH
jgi:hypothetical protein